MLVGNLALLAWDAERLGPLIAARSPEHAR
jgi:hypothetical protein